MGLVILTIDKNLRKMRARARGQEELEIGELYASEKYSDISPIY
jgi:hypothetical protein